MLGVLKWVNPLYWPYAAVKAVVKTPLWFVRKTFQALQYAWNQPKTTLGKWTLRPLYIWIAIPGTVPFSLFHMGKMFGFEEELMFMLDGMAAATAGTGAVALDLFGKVAFHAVILGAKLLPLIGFALS